MGRGFQLLLLAAMLSGIAADPCRAANVVNYHNDLSSSGVNSAETALTLTNVNTSTFAKLHTVTMDGQVYAQPLFLPNVNVTSGALAGTHNLVFAATQHDSLYAIDADSGAVVWQDSFLTSGLAGATSITSVPAGDTGTGDTSPEVGICSTPVIDTATNMMFVVAKTKQIVNNNTSVPDYVYTLYKIDVTTGNIAASTLMAVTAYNGSSYTFRTNTSPSAAQDPFVAGTGDGAITVNGQSRVYFNSLRCFNRCGLFLLNGSVYIASASHGDQSPYHGWLLAYSESTLAPTAVCNMTPNGGLGGIWCSGAAPVVDSNNSIYLMVGNGTFDGNISGSTVTGLNAQGMPANGNYGDCFVRIVADATTTAASQNINGWGLKIADYFSPFNNQSLNSNDTDVGSGGCMLLPASAGSTAHQHLLVGAGKQGSIYLIDCASMGHFNTTDHLVQPVVSIGSCFDTPAFFNGNLYFAGEPDNGKAFTVSNAVMSTTPVKTPDTFAFPGSTPSVSVNGTSNGIVWMINRSPGQLRAYSASALGTELWTSDQASGSRDSLGTPAKFVVPTVANGHVFVGTTTSLVIYGLLSAPTFTSGAPTSPASAGVAYTFNITASGAPTPTFSVTSGTLPPGLTLSSAGAISGTPNSPGSYSGVVTASNGINPAATQSFSITVNNTYNFWTTQEGLTGNNALPTAIVSHDGVTNLMKYALGLNPFTTYNPSSPGLPVVQTQNFSGTNYLTLTFTGVATDVTYNVQASSDLATWTTIYTHSGSPAPGTVTVQDTQAVTASPDRYLRLQVTQ